jgi:hypothetical protein
VSRHQVDVPEGKVGDWEVKRFEIGKAKSAMLSATTFSHYGRGIPPGKYTELTHRGSVVMSDTPSEIRDLAEFFWEARGKVLIHGLGLGVCVQAALRKPEVEHVLVIEKSPEVIELAADHYRTRFGSRLEVQEGDAFTWKPETGRRWDCVWHDVWTGLCEDNLSEMATLHRRFGHRCDWQGSWGKELLQDRRRQRRAAGW